MTRIEGDNLIERACSECKGTGMTSPGDRGKFIDPDYCDDCGGSGLEFVDLACLLHNLAVAGALCEAFDLGMDQAELFRLYHEFGYRMHSHWRPGCGRSAP